VNGGRRLAKDMEHRTASGDTIDLGRRYGLLHLR
jgi:hypothetical protein